MRLVHLIVTCSMLALVFASSTFAKEWRGIVPLRSTRADVERLFGPAEPGSSGGYATESERISVSYSDRPCAHDWQVPVGTVISFSVYPKNPPKVAELKLDASRYEKRRDYHIENIYYYVDSVEGINYTVDMGQGVVTGIEYYPAAKDNSLRCSLVKNSSTGIKGTSKFDEYVDKPADEKKRLDRFAGSLLQDSNNQGYIVVYSGRRSYRNEAQGIARRIKNYLVNTRGMDPDKISTIDGGYRDQATIQLYLGPSGSAPPEPAPTVKPEEAQIIDRGKKRRARPKP